MIVRCTLSNSPRKVSLHKRNQSLREWSTRVTQFWMDSLFLPTCMLAVDMTRFHWSSRVQTAITGHSKDHWTQATVNTRKVWFRLMLLAERRHSLRDQSSPRTAQWSQRTQSIRTSLTILKPMWRMMMVRCRWLPPVIQMEASTTGTALKSDQKSCHKILCIFIDFARLAEKYIHYLHVFDSLQAIAKSI